MKPNFWNDTKCVQWQDDLDTSHRGSTENKANAHKCVLWLST